MRVWFKNIASMLGIEDAEERSVREILAAAAQRSAVVGLSPSGIDVCPDPECCMLDAVEGDAVSLVWIGGAPRPEIVPGATFQIAIATSRGFHRGETTILSRWNEPGDAGARRRIGFLASLPPSLTHVQRRNSHRVPVAFDLAPFAQLYVPPLADPVCKAPIVDLSDIGLRVRIPAALAEQLSCGQQLVISAEFAATIPSFRSSVEVMRIAASKVPDSRVVGLRFVEPMTELTHAIRAIDLRRSTRSVA
jgi:hypothetical protein